MENTLRRKFQSSHRSVLKSGKSRASVQCWILSFCSMDGNTADTLIHSSKSASVFVLFFCPEELLSVQKMVVCVVRSYCSVTILSTRWTAA